MDHAVCNIERKTLKLVNGVQLDIDDRVELDQESAAGNGGNHTLFVVLWCFHDDKPNEFGSLSHRTWTINIT